MKPQKEEKRGNTYSENSTGNLTSIHYSIDNKVEFN